MSYPDVKYPFDGPSSIKSLLRSASLRHFVIAGGIRVPPLERLSFQSRRMPSSPDKRLLSDSEMCVDRNFLVIRSKEALADVNEKKTMRSKAHAQNSIGELPFRGVARS